MTENGALKKALEPLCNAPAAWQIVVAAVNSIAAVAVTAFLVAAL